MSLPDTEIKSMKENISITESDEIQFHQPGKDSQSLINSNKSMEKKTKKLEKMKKMTMMMVLKKKLKMINYLKIILLILSLLIWIFYLKNFIYVQIVKIIFLINIFLLTI